VTRGRIIYLLKALISIGFLAVLFMRLSDFRSILDGLDELLTQNIPFLSLSILLIFFNWWLEGLKWKLLLDKCFPVTVKDAIKYVLTGVTVGFITPGRSGEFAGRMILLPEGKRLQTLALSMLGGIAQIIPTVLAGIIFSCFSSLHVISQTADTVLLLGALAVFLIIYFGFTFLSEWSWSKKYLIKIDVSKEILPSFSKKVLVLFLSFVRHSIFIVQYALLLEITGISFRQSIAPVSWMFLLQSLSPAVALLDVGVRGNIAIWVFTRFELYQPVVLAAVFLIWFMNLCLPALVGYFFILRWKKTNSSIQ